jgi:uncharacterized RmlC-like cupin family protein
MTDPSRWRDSVSVVRAASLAAAAGEPGKGGRATAFDFTGSGGHETWIGTVTMSPSGMTGAHHHGRHEVMIYVARGRAEIRWGERLEFLANVEPGDFIYFAPFVPHQERNPSATETVDFVVVRSDRERIAVALEADVDPAPQAVG